MLVRFYRVTDKHSYSEECYYVELTRALAPDELDLLKRLIGTPLNDVSSLTGFKVMEIGPRLSVETPFSSSAVAICESMGLPVRRIEKSNRYALTSVAFAESSFDPMTQEVYPSPLRSFGKGKEPEPVREIDVIGQGKRALQAANKTLGLGMDDWDEDHWAAYFAWLRRNPTDVELFQIGNGNSEHSRHWLFRGIQVIDGVEMPESLMDIVKEPWKRDPGNSLVAFHDNSGVIEGWDVDVFLPETPGMPSEFGILRLRQHITSTAETHNHPTFIAPFPGAETGAGGRIRDDRAVGRGGLVHAGLAGYCVSNLHFPGYKIPGENVGGEHSRRHASPLDILIQGSNGVSDYGNKIGEPLIAGFCRSFDQMVDGKRRGYLKPVLYSAGTGRLLDMHVTKRSPEAGMLIVRIGGPAYRIGVGGGSASSMIHGAQSEELDLKSVQRGNAEMENRVNRVIQTCAEMLEMNPIESIHDQGAGGPSNVLTELMEPAGGRVDIRKITVGDRTMSVLEIWVAEYQEGYGLLVTPENLDVFKSICERERVNCEVLGDITGDGNVVVYDPADNTTPVNLALKDILGDLPRKRFESKRLKRTFQPLVIPEDLTVEDALRMVFRLPHVGSKGFLVHKADRSVTGLVAQQQCCGPMQVPVSDIGVTADGYFGLTGAATALGEQPIKMLIDPAAGARMAVAEMLTNLCSAKITKLSDVKCRANWMWAAKLPGEGSLLRDAAVAMRDCMIALGIAITGGKDSLSMATEVGGEQVVAPGTLVIKGIAPVPDITKVVTPDLKGSGCLGHIKIGGPFWRLGGSALAQALEQIGNEAPDVDVDDAPYLARAFAAVQELIGQGIITAYHDVSDGGLITAVAEMCIAGNRGASIRFNLGTDIFAALFAEEAGMLFEYAPKSRALITRVMKKHGVVWESSRNQIATVKGETGGDLIVSSVRDTWLRVPVTTLREWWEETSMEAETKQTSPECVKAERMSHSSANVLEYKLPFTPKAPALTRDRAPKVAILREEGTNGDREMAAAFFTAGLRPYDVMMSDLLKGRVTSLDEFRGLVFPGGFSYADVFGSARGWAGPIRFTPRVQEMFDRFYERPDTFSLGVCNGCQLMANIGWLPYKGIKEASQPRLIHNKSGRFESRWVGMRIFPSPSIFLRGMEGSVLGIWIAHGEGRFLFPDPQIAEEIGYQHLRPLAYVDPDGRPTERYPYNPNGSPLGIAGICSPDGRHLAMMPHPERAFLKWQWPTMPEKFRSLDCSPWLQMFQNTRTWCLEH